MESRYLKFEAASPGVDLVSQFYLGYLESLVFGTIFAGSPLYAVNEMRRTTIMNSVLMKVSFVDYQVFILRASYTYLLEESICLASMMQLKVSPSDTSSHDPSLGLPPVRTGALLHGPDDGLTCTRNCRLT